MSSTPDLQKLPREPTVKASTKEEEWEEIPTTKNLQKQKPKPEAKKPEWPRRARPDAVLIKSTEGASYAAILKDLKNWASLSRELGRRTLKIFWYSSNVPRRTEGGWIPPSNRLLVPIGLSDTPSTGLS